MITTFLPHQQRVLDERKELATKAAALSEFRKTDIYKSLGVDEQRRLSRQIGIMDLYVDVLDERIEAFGGPVFRGLS